MTPRRTRTPPSWTVVFATSIAHGVAMGALIVVASALGSRPTHTPFRLIATTILVTSFAALLLRFPYARMAAIAAWLSPLAACAVVTAVFAQRTPPPSPMSPTGTVLFVGAAFTFSNAVTSFVLLFTLRTLGMLPERDTTRCSACGYSLVGLESRRCPECGTPIA